MSEISLESLAEKLKQYRKEQQLTLEQLAEQSGVSRSMISQIERQKANPTLAIACRIAKALNISIAELVEEPWTQPSIEVVSADASDNIMRDDENGFVQMLTPPNSTTEFYRVRIAPAAALNSKPHFRGTCEIITAHRGEITVLSGHDSRRLKQGDTAYYRADQNHCIINRSDEEALLYMVICLEEPNAAGYEWDLAERSD